MKKIIMKQGAILFSVLIGLFLTPIVFNLNTPIDLNSNGDDLDENNTDVFKLPKTSDTDIDIITPENKTYTAPMSGYYLATYDYEHVPDGSLPEDYFYKLGGTRPEPSKCGAQVVSYKTDAVGNRHDKVLELRDYSSGSINWMKDNFLESGSTEARNCTIEFYALVNIESGIFYQSSFGIEGDSGMIARLQWHKWSSGNPDIRYRDGDTFYDSGINQPFNRWYRYSVDISCDGGYAGLSANEWRFRIYNEYGTLIYTSGILDFMNDHPTGGACRISMASSETQRTIREYLDAIGITGLEDNYQIGDNEEEGLLLSFNSDITLDWMGYSLDAQPTKTILGDTTLPMPVEGPHTIQVFGEDPLGTIYQSDVRHFSIQDDDETPPEVSNLVITHDIHNVNISFDAIDQSGISKIEILVNGELIEPINQFQKNNNYLFMLSNKWILKNDTYEVEIRITDADDDRPNDSLTTTITGTFDITLENMYKYVDWQIESLKSYVDENLYWILSRLIIYKLTMAQKHLTKAYELIENDRIPCGLFHDATAKTLINIAESRTELFNRLSFIEDEVANYMINSIHEIRNNVVILIGASVGTEQSYQIALIEIKLLNLQDLIEDEICWWHRIGLNHLIGGAAAKLEMAIFKLSLDINIESTLISTQFKLELAKNKILNLLNHGKISNDLAETLITKINQIKSEIEIVKNLS